MCRFLAGLLLLTTSNSALSFDDSNYQLFIAKSDTWHFYKADKNIIYKGEYFYIEKDDLNKNGNRHCLVKMIESYPFSKLINGCLNIDDFVSPGNAKRIIEWPFSLWKKDITHPVNNFFEFKADGSVRYYSDDEGSQYRGNVDFYGHLYLVDDIVIVKEENGAVFPIAIYMKTEGRLCPIGRSSEYCREYLANPLKNRDYYLERFEDITLQVETGE